MKHNTYRVIKKRNRQTTEEDKVLGTEYKRQKINFKIKVSSLKISRNNNSKNMHTDRLWEVTDGLGFRSLS